MASADLRTAADAPGARAALNARRYGTVAVALHWIIALLILVQIGLGWYMNEVLPDHTPAQDAAEGLHISIGLTTFMLILLRIGWRLVNPPPPLPAEIAGWERWLVRLTHFLFYALMLALPLTGWAMVTLQPDPILFWGLHFPHLPGITQLAGANHRPLRKALQLFHTDIFVWIVLANLALHVAGALKHQFDGHPVLWRMLPFLRPRRS